MTIKARIVNSSERLTATLDRASKPARGIWPRFPDALLGIFALVVVFFSLLTYSPTVARAASKLVRGNKYLALADGFLNPFRNRQLLLNSGLPIYDLTISSQEFAVVEDTVAQAIEQGWMSDDLKVWVNGTFIYAGEEFNVKVRVRGDLPNHWEGPKKSWSVRFGKRQIVEDGETREEAIYFEGKRRINLVIPGARDYVLAPFTNQLMREAGLVVPRDQFVVLRINGVLQGLYYEVEDFDTPLLVAYDQPETSAIFSQTDRAMHFEQYTKYGTAGASDANFDLGSMSLAVDEQGELARRAMQVLIDHSLHPTAENFRRVRAVLDWEKYLRFRALTTLLNTNHVRFGSDNFKLVYDQSRGVLEPIPWDVHLIRMPKEPGTVDYWNSHGPDEIQRATLMDRELRLQRNQILWELVADGGGSFMDKYDELHERIRPLAWADVLGTPVHGYRMDEIRADLQYNVRRVHKVLSLSSANLTYQLEADDRAAIDIVTLNFSGIKLQEIQISDPLPLEGAYQLYADANENGEFDPGDPLLAETTAQGGTIRFAPDRYIFPEVRYDNDFLDGRYWEYFDTLAGRSRLFLVGKLTPERRHPLDWTPPEIQVTAVNAVTGLPIPSGFVGQAELAPDNSIGITAYDASDPYDLEAPELSLAEFLEAHPEFAASRERPGAAELSGSVTISGTVIVPRSVPLILRPGVNLTMMPGASVLSYGGLTAIGTPENRIRIHGAGSGEAWNTFAVVQSPEAVVLKYTDIQGGGQAQVNGFLFTGGFAVYDTDLHLEQCRFSNMQSEDAVNIKNGNIVMKDCLIANTASDALDIDFGTGEVRDSQFLNIQGDGVDLSGSTVTVAGNRFENIGDKGTSVGEDSHPIIINNLYRNCQIGISTKDLSYTRAAYSTFVDNVVAIEAKRKKAWYGPGSGEFINNVFSGNETLLDEDYFSSGLAAVRNSLVEVQSDCPACRTAVIRFRSPEAGDFMLAPESLADSRFELAPAEWAQLELDANGSAPQQPGIFSNPRGADIDW